MDRGQSNVAPGFAASASDSRAPIETNVTPSAEPSRSHDWALSLLLVVATVVVYFPAWYGTPIWDDDAHLTKSELRSLAGLAQIWIQPGATQQFYPLAHTVFWLENQLWGTWPFGYHLVNILLHSLSSLILFRILRELEIPGAFLATAIFALHPIQAESVAWISELKNTLSSVFYFGSGLAYLKFAQDKKVLPYATALVLFILGLMSKTVIASLPGALLVVFWWKRGKLSWRQDVYPLLPFFAVGVTAGLFTAWVERTLVGATGSEFNFSIFERFLIAGRVVWFYLGKLLWPVDLMFVYPRWQVNPSVWWQSIYPLATLLLLAALMWLSRWRRGPLAALLFYVGTLFPVLGFINVYPFRYSFVADHFQYLAGLGIIVPFSAGTALLLRGLPRWSQSSGFLLCTVLPATLFILTWRQCAMYTDASTVWQTTIKRNPKAWMAHENLGVLFLETGRPEDAIDQFNKALTIKPDHASAEANLGNAFLRMGQLDEAIVYYEKALQLKSDSAEFQYNLANALLRKGEFDEAVSHFRRALELKPRDADFHNNLGTVLLQKGDLDGAIDQYQQALELKPADVKAQANLAWALAISPETPQTKGAIALKLAQKANQMTGGENPVVLHILAAAYAQIGLFDEAVKTAQLSLQLATARNSPVLADSLRREIELYRNGLPDRIGP
jgi:Flp pilus assembly protein TadD